MSDSRNWPALGAAVRRRRAALGLPQELGPVGGPSDFTIRNIERGATRAIRPKTKHQIEQALRWPPGTVERLLDGTATEEEIMPNDASTDADPDPSDPRQARRNEAAARYADIAARIRVDVESGRLDAAPGYHLELRAEAARLRLFGVEAPRPVTFRSEPVPVLADPDPTAELPGDQGASPFEMYAEGLTYTTIGKYMVARDRRNRSS